MSKVLDHDISPPRAWTANDLPDSAGLIIRDDNCRGELLKIAEILLANPLPILSLRTADFDLPCCKTLMTAVSEQLDHGLGFAIVDRLPLGSLNTHIATSLYWLLASMIERPVAQSWDGKLLYDVRDTGKRPGNGVRPDITSAGQNLHTDNSYNLCPPNYDALLCINTAMKGGVSQLVSFHAVHNYMRAHCPELLARLYQDYIFDRQREHAPDDVKMIKHPLFTWDGTQLKGRLSKRMVIQGYELAGQNIDKESFAALAALETTMNRPEMMKEFEFRPGQIQFINNKTIGHARTAFLDWPEPGRKRHLIRLWLRNEGRAFYNG